MFEYINRRCIYRKGHWKLESEVLDLKMGASWAVLVGGPDPVVAKTVPKGGPELDDKKSTQT